MVEYEGTPAEDAGGPRRQFFDEFPQAMRCLHCLLYAKRLMLCVAG
jgi:hypothetical protein